MTRESLISMALLTGVIAIVASIHSPIQAQPKAGKAVLPPAELQKQADNLQLKAAAIDALIAFESSARTRFRGYCELLTEYIELIDKTSDPCARRALYWRFLAEQVLQSREELLVVQYSELVESPADIGKKMAELVK